MRIFSWNVNGLRAIINKGALQDFIAAEQPDILCIQETKAKPGQAEIDFPEYEELWNSAKRPGYSGTAIFTKIKPISVNNTLPTEQDFTDQFGDPLDEGRIQTAEFEKFYLVNIYTPNSKRDLERLKLRETMWDPAILKYVKELEKNKPVVICGDFNAAHDEIDLARPQANHRNAGFTDEERKGVSNLLNVGSPAENAFIIFLVAELTDTFDGTCARKWPFPKNKEPKYRKYAATYDMVSDVLLAAAQVLFLTLQVNLIAGLIIIIFYTVVCGIIELVVYGKLLGHPDNCTPNSLTKKNFPLAKKIVLTRRYLYTICLGIANAFILFATSWPDPVKYILFAFGCSIFIFIWFFLRQRRKNVSRDAVNIEKELTKKVKK